MFLLFGGRRAKLGKFGCCFFRKIVVDLKFYD
jgi:hypothetical protein